LFFNLDFVWIIYDSLISNQKDLEEYLVGVPSDMEKILSPSPFSTEHQKE